MIRLFLITLFFVSGICNGQNPEGLKFPENSKLSSKFKDAIKEKTNEYNRPFYRDSAATKNYSAQFILDKIDNERNYDYIFLSEYWIAFHYKEIIPELIKRVSNKTEVGLVNTADLIIWERIECGDLTFYGEGGVSRDDLFTVAGRANRLLTEITGEDFGHVSMYSTPEQLTGLQKKWINWLKQL